MKPPSNGFPPQAECSSARPCANAKANEVACSASLKQRQCQACEVCYHDYGADQDQAQYDRKDYGGSLPRCV